MAAELQTITAAINVTQLAWHICIFIKNVQNADAAAERLYQKTRQLHRTLQSVEAGLRRRHDERKNSPPAPNETQIESNISASLEASRLVLLRIEKKLVALNEKQGLSLSTRAVARLQFTLKQQAILRHEDDIDLQIQALQTSLGALQL
jgi:hypothetical protein